MEKRRAAAPNLLVRRSCRCYAAVTPKTSSIVSSSAQVTGTKHQRDLRRRSKLLSLNCSSKLLPHFGTEGVHDNKHNLSISENMGPQPLRPPVAPPPQKYDSLLATV